MKRSLLMLALLATPVFAQPAFAEAEASPDMSEGMGLIERGIQMFLRGALTEVEPQLDEMARTLDELQGKLGPAMAELSPKLIELMRLMGDLDQYDMPEKLANGDIIIRRKPAPIVAPNPDGSIDL
jgi:hypothetical protein